MLKNLDPVLSGDLLVTLDEMQPGEWLVLTSGTGPIMVPNEGHTVIDLAATSIEGVAAAVLSVFPLDAAGAPIVFLDDLDGREELPDMVFAISGIAADAELRRVPMSTLGEREFRHLAADAAATVRADIAGEPGSFLLRKGDLVTA
ncbi:RbsD/FucU domain-containing protein [Gryllotalpicola koreensis]|uniref:Uncharacterized protein n=1 Tax=Gryllotalpicola koreensis TaxID=993086 RepID=A0ABP7ZUP0_9MICO